MLSLMFNAYLAHIGGGPLLFIFSYCSFAFTRFSSSMSPGIRGKIGRLEDGPRLRIPCFLLRSDPTHSDRWASSVSATTERPQRKHLTMRLLQKSLWSTMSLKYRISPQSRGQLVLIIPKWRINEEVSSRFNSFRNKTISLSRHSLQRCFPPIRFVSKR